MLQTSPERLGLSKKCAKQTIKTDFIERLADDVTNINRTSAKDQLDSQTTRACNVYRENQKNYLLQDVCKQDPVSTRTTADKISSNTSVKLQEAKS